MSSEDARTAFERLEQDSSRGVAPGATTREATFVDAAGFTVQERPLSPSVGGTVLESATSAPQGPRRRLNLPTALDRDYDYLQDLSSQGAQADVILARHRISGALRAIKIYRGAFDAVDADAIRTLEAVALADQDRAFQHVVPFQFETEGYDAWEIQEYFPLGTLADVAAAHHQGVPVEVGMAVLRELTEALAFIHSHSVVHRDLKPPNVLVRATDPLDLVLTDFGVARQQAGTQVIATVAGSFPYMAPEATFGESGVAGDWWAMGVILHELLTGAHFLADPVTGCVQSDAVVRVALNRRSYTISGLPDQRWDLLVHGLLTWESRDRWGLAQVREWLAGGSPDVVEARHEGPISAEDFVFNGVGVYTPRDLAAGLRAAPRVAQDLVGDVGRYQLLTEWLSRFGIDDRARALGKTPDVGVRVVRLQALLDPASAPVLGLGTLSVAGLDSVARRAIDGDEAAGQWIRDLRGNGALRRYAADVAGQTELARIDERLTTWWQRIDDAEVNGQLGEPEDRRALDLEGGLLRAAVHEKVRSQQLAAVTKDLGNLREVSDGFATHVREVPQDQEHLGVLMLLAARLPEERGTHRTKTKERRAAEAAKKARVKADRGRVREAARRDAWRRARSGFLGAIAWLIPVIVLSVTALSEGRSARVWPAVWTVVPWVVATSAVRGVLHGVREGSRSGVSVTVGALALLWWLAQWVPSFAAVGATGSVPTSMAMQLFVVWGVGFVAGWLAGLLPRVQADAPWTATLSGVLGVLLWLATASSIVYRTLGASIAESVSQAPQWFLDAGDWVVRTCAPVAAWQPSWAMPTGATLALVLAVLVGVVARARPQPPMVLLLAYGAVAAALAFFLLGNVGFLLAPMLMFGWIAFGVLATVLVFGVLASMAG